MYNNIIIENFTNPKNTAELTEHDFIINTGNPVCDDRISIWVKLENNKISATRQKAYGCATSLATASIFSEYIKGKQIVDFEKTHNVEQMAIELLGELEPSQMHCYEIFSELFENLTQNITAHVL